jgi:N-acetylmuramoyl-L-alanine amidase
MGVSCVVIGAILFHFYGVKVKAFELDALDMLKEATDKAKAFSVGELVDVAKQTANDLLHSNYGYSVNLDEIQLLAKTVWHEAELESFEGKVAIVNNIMNRVIHSDYPDTIREVVFQPLQYSYSHEIPGRPVTDENIRAVYEALMGNEQIGRNVLFYSNESAENVCPWMQHTRVLAKKIGNHTFRY